MSRLITKKQAAATIDWSDDQIASAEIDYDRLIKIIQHLREAQFLMNGSGLHVYGAAGSGCLIHSSRPTHSGDSGEKADRGSVVASIGLGFDGGDW